MGKLTLKEVKEYCKSVNSEFRSDKYINSEYKYDFKCVCCDNTITKSLNKFKYGQNRCKTCVNKSRSEKHKNKIEDIASFCENVGSEFLDNFYESHSFSHKFKCIECGESFNKSWENFKNSNYKCSKCNNSISWNKNSVKSWIEQNRPEFKLIDFYVEKGNSRVKISYLERDNCYNIDWISFKNGANPKEIYFELNNINKSKEQVTKSFKNIGLNILDIENYKNCNTRISAIDKKGYKHKVCYSSQISEGKAFYKFLKSNPYTIDNIKLWIKTNRDDYELVSTEYHGNKYKLTFKYIGEHWSLSEEDRIFKMAWSKFQAGQRHPKLTISSGEEKAIKIFNKHKIEFIPQKSFNNCVYINKLRFDFYLPKHNKLLEIMGRQHYQPVDIFGGREGFELTKIRDEIKRKYAKDNSINMLEISYDEFDNMEDIILDFIEEEI